MTSALRIREVLGRAPYFIADPGNGNPITIVPEKVGTLGVVPIASVGVETRTVDAPTKAGLFVTLNMQVYGGAVTVTVTGTYDGSNSTLTLSAAGQWYMLYSITTAPGVYRWSLFPTTGLSGGATATSLALSAGMGLFGSALLASQPASANQAVVTQTQDALVDNSGGSASTTIAVISDTATKNAVASLVAELAKARADVAALIVLTTALRAALVPTTGIGLIKGSA